MSLADVGLPQNYIDRIKATIQNGSIMHAYIIESDSRIDKLALAKEFAKALLCESHSGDACDRCLSCSRIDHDNHEDIVMVETNEHGNVVDKAIEELITALRRKPLVGDRTVAIVPGADSMTARAQNHLLKTLEEPAGNSTVILLSDNAENLLQTIRSRCVIYRINDYSRMPETEMTELAAEIAEMLISSEPFYQVVKAIAPAIANRQATLQFLEALEYVYRDILLGNSSRSRLYKRQYIYDAVSYIEEAKRDITAITGINATYVLKDVLLKIGG